MTVAVDENLLTASIDTPEPAPSTKSTPFVDGLEAIRISDKNRTDMENGHDMNFLHPRFAYIAEKLEAVINFIYGSNKAAGQSIQAILVYCQSTSPQMQWRAKGLKPSIRILSLMKATISRSAMLTALKDYPSLDTLPYSMALKKLPSIFGKRLDEIADYDRLAPTSLARETEQCWPFMHRLHCAGQYSSLVCIQLLLISAVRERLLSQEPLTGVERNFLLLTSQYMLGTLPDRLEYLAGLYFPALNKTLPFSYTFAGITYKDVTDDFDIWEQVPNELPITIRSLALGVYAEAEEVPCPLESLSRQVVSSTSLATQLSGVLTAFFTDKLRPAHEQLNKYFELSSRTLNIPYTQCLELPSDTVSISNITHVADLDKALLLTRKLFSWVGMNADHQKVLDEANERMASISETQDRINELSSDRTIDSLLEIANLAEQAKSLIACNQEWYRKRHEEFLQYQAGGMSIIAEINALNEACAVSTAPPAALAPEAASKDNPVDDTNSQRIAQLEDKLSTALVDGEHLRSELKQAKVDLHKLRTAASVTPSIEQQQVHVTQFDPELINRVMLRSNLSAHDVLDYFSAVAGDRVAILESAYRSANDLTPSSATLERMIDLMHKTIFPYLDAINSGSPDTTARLVFSSKSYSAKESHSTIQNLRLGALRDFNYQGQTIRFERHLRVSNGTGKDGMRIYFDIINGKVIIAYAGAHLDNGTN